MNIIPVNQQPIEKRREFDDGETLEVHSIFYTIQGEGPFAGHPAVFVRLAGCNLQCPSCDTEYTQGRIKMLVDEIITNIRKHAEHAVFSGLVVITGGEPFRQNITPFVIDLVRHGYTVQIETNGTLPPAPWFPSNAVVVCSPKTGKVNAALQPFISAYKYVLSYDSVDMDGLPIRALNHSAAPRVARPHVGFNGAVYLQPMDPKDSVEYELNVSAVRHSCMRNGYILQLQIHKLIGVD